MLFNSLYFLLFLLIVLIGYHAVLRSFAARKLFLLAASWAFYASWSPRFLLLLITTTFIDFELARVIFRARNAGAMHRARVLLVGSLAINLGLLAFFKYGLFFYQSANALVALPPPAGFLSVVVPLGISFYTFHSISYVIDTYRGIRPPTDSFADFALYVAFFPQLIAGPITRWVFEGVRQATLDELAEMGRAANRMLGLRERSVGSFSALAHLLNRSYVIDYARHPTADTLRAIAEDLRAANVPFFFYVAPIDVDRYVAQGQYEPVAMAARLEALRRAVGASPAEWLDLHDTLRSPSFRDWQNHLTLAGCPKVAHPLAQRIRDRLAHRKARG